MSTKYQVKYIYNKRVYEDEYRTQVHDTMRMAIASANFLDAKGDYKIIHIIPITVDS